MTWITWPKLKEVHLPRNVSTCKTFYVQEDVRCTHLAFDTGLVEEIEILNFKLPMGMRRQILLKALHKRKAQPYCKN